MNHRTFERILRWGSQYLSMPGRVSFPNLYIPQVLHAFLNESACALVIILVCLCETGESHLWNSHKRLFKWEIVLCGWDLKHTHVCVFIWNWMSHPCGKRLMDHENVLFFNTKSVWFIQTHSFYNEPIYKTKIIIIKGSTFVVVSFRTDLGSDKITRWI